MTKFYLNSKNPIFDSIPKKPRTDRRTEGWTDPLLLDPSSYCQGSTSKTAVDWHLKVKDTEYDVDLTKNYCITVNMQKISSFNKLILKIQQILESHELNGHAFFDHAHAKIIEITFSFLEFAPTCKKSVHSICSFSKYHQF